MTGGNYPVLGVPSPASFPDAVQAEIAAAIPAEDGGYCAIALSAGAPWMDAFRDVPWSTPDVLAVTRDRLAARGAELDLVSGGYDVDRPEDVGRLRRDLALRDPEAADFPRATALALTELP